MCSQTATRLVLLGAGADSDLGLPSGNNFTLQTFYAKKPNMYKALKDFYSERHAPKPYSGAFLFAVNSNIFSQLCYNILEQDAALLKKALPEFNCVAAAQRMHENGKLNEIIPLEERKELFNMLILEHEDENGVDDQTTSARSALEQSGLLGTAHYGLLESYYSALIEPEKHSRRLWKLINFYWSAYFCVAAPVLQKNRSVSKNTPSYYQQALKDLKSFTNDLIEWADSVVKTNGNCYYNKLSGKFDYVATTNYTPFADSIEFRGDEKSAIRLSGSLTQFERLDTLTTFDLKGGNDIPTDTVIFPYLMCQSPVKPIIELHQIEEYGRMAKDLKQSTEIAVLGYSFCKEDTHIATMIGQSLHENPDQHCTFFKYLNEQELSDQKDDVQERTQKELWKLLRLKDPSARERITVKFIEKDCKTELDDYLANLT